MDETDPYAPRPLAGWFYFAAGASALFMALGCAVYIMHVSLDPATLPLDQRAAYLAEPAWLQGMNAIAVWVGLIGAILLLLRRKLAEAVIGVSLLATIGWVIGLMAVPAMREAMTANDLALAVAIAAIVWTIFWFARHSRQRGWLR